MPVNEHLAAAFKEAHDRYPKIASLWVRISHRIGGLLPKSLLIASIQRAGQIDLVLRCLEDEIAPKIVDGSEIENILHPTHLNMLSHYWTGDLYETLRLLRERHLIEASKAFDEIFCALALVRVTLDKHEVPKDNKLKEPLTLVPMPQLNGDEQRYTYDKEDPKRAHVMPSGWSKRGSPMWLAIDHQNNRSFWVERRAISDRILGLLEDLAA